MGRKESCLSPFFPRTLYYLLKNRLSGYDPLISMFITYFIHYQDLYFLYVTESDRPFLSKP